MIWVIDSKYGRNFSAERTKKYGMNREQVNSYGKARTKAIPMSIM